LNADVPDTCKECGSDDLVEDHAQGDVICRNCGLVAAERIVDLGSEWRNFENDDSGTDPSRVGGLYSHKSLKLLYPLCRTL